MYIALLKKSIWKGNVLYDSNHMTFWKRQNYSENKKGQWLPGVDRRDKYSENRGNLQQQNYTVWYCSGEYVPVYICQNPQNIQYQG